MAVETLRINITADNKAAIGAMKQTKDAVNSMGKSFDDVDRQLQKLNNQLKNLKFQKEFAGSVTSVNEIDKKISSITKKIESLGGVIPEVGTSLKNLGETPELLKPIGIIEGITLRIKDLKSRLIEATDPAIINQLNGGLIELQTKFNSIIGINKSGISSEFVKMPGLVEAAANRLTILKNGLKSATDPDDIKTINRLIQAQEVEYSRLSSTGIPSIKGVSAAFNQSAGIIDIATNRLTLLKNGLKTATDPSDIKTINREIQIVQAQLKQTTNVGKAGFDEMGVAIKKSGSGLGGLLGPVRQLAYILPGIGMAGLFSLAFEGIEKMVEGLGLFKKETDDAAESQKKFNEELSKQVTSGAEEVSKLKALEDVASNAAVAMDKRKLAVKELRDQYPAYFKDLTDEQILTGDVTTATDALTTAIYARAEARAREADIAKKAAQVFENQQKIDKINLDIEKARERKSKGSVVIGGGTLGGISGGRDEGYERAVSKELDLIKQKDDLLNQNSQLQSQIASSQIKVNSLTADTITLDEKSAKTTRHKLTEAEKWAEFLKKFQGKMAAEQAASMNLPQIFAPKEKELKATPLPASTDFSRNPYKKMFADMDKDWDRQAKNAMKFANSVASSFSTIIQSGQSLGESLSKVFEEIGKKILETIVKALVLATIFEITGLGGATGAIEAIGGKGTGLGGLFKSLMGFASGGTATGPSSGYPVLLHGTEHIVRPDQMSKIIGASAQMGSQMSNNGQTVNVVGKIMGQDIWLSKQRTDYNRGLTT